MKGAEKHMYFVKVVRMLKCAEIFDIQRFMKYYKDYVKWNVNRILENDPKQADDIHEDIIVITRQIMAGKIF